MKHLFSFFSGFFFMAVLAAQPGIQWQKCIGGPSIEGANAIKQTADGGFIIVGKAQSDGGIVTGTHGGVDLWVVKINSDKGIEWQRIIGGSGTDFGLFVIQTSDMGYIIVGRTDSNDGDVSGNHGTFDAWVIKLDSSGAIIWLKVLGGSDLDGAYSVLQMPDGGYMMAGYTHSNDGDISEAHGSSDFWMVRLSPEGNIEWQSLLGGSSYDSGTSIQNTTDGGYIIAGFSSSSDGDVSENHGFLDFWVVKTDATGILEWEKSFGGAEVERATAIRQTIDGGYVVLGSTRSNEGGFHGPGDCDDILVIKLSETGDVQWKKWLGGSGDERAQTIEQTFDGGFVVAGLTEGSINGDVSGNHGASDVWIVKLDNEGNIKWQRALGGGNFEFIMFSSGSNMMQQTLDGGYIVAAETHSINGNVYLNHGGSDMWLVKLSPEVVGTTDPSSQASMLQIFPNPARQSIQIKAATEANTLALRITDLLGREVLSQNIQNGASVDISMLPNGLYLVSATMQDGKLFLQRFRKQG